jgi:hypothetical protein
MSDYKKYKKVLIGNKTRTLYKKANSKKLYIKHNKKMMSYQTYKKMKSLKKSKKSGGNREEEERQKIEQNKREFISILDRIASNHDVNSLAFGSVSRLSLGNRSPPRAASPPRTNRKRKLGLSIETPEQFSYSEAEHFLRMKGLKSQRQVLALLEGRRDLINKFDRWISSLP